MHMRGGRSRNNNVMWQVFYDTSRQRKEEKKIICPVAGLDDWIRSLAYMADAATAAPSHTAVQGLAASCTAEGDSCDSFYAVHIEPYRGGFPI